MACTLQSGLTCHISVHCQPIAGLRNQRLYLVAVTPNVKLYRFPQLPRLLFLDGIRVYFSRFCERRCMPPSAPFIEGLEYPELLKANLFLSWWCSKELGGYGSHTCSRNWHAQHAWRLRERRQRPTCDAAFGVGDPEVTARSVSIKCGQCFDSELLTFAI